MKRKHVLFLAAIVMSFALPAAFAEAESEVKSEVKEMAQDVKKGTKKAVNKVKDETCELVNGKMECFAKKVGHKVENVKEEVKDKTN